MCESAGLAKAILGEWQSALKMERHEKRFKGMEPRKIEFWKTTHDGVQRMLWNIC